jgi:integrase
VAQVSTDMDRGDHIDPQVSRTPFARLADEWLATNPGGKVQTRLGYEGMLRNHVLPYFGHMDVGRITKATVRQFLAAMEDKGAGPGTTRNAFRNVLKPTLDLAVDLGMVRVNPAVGVKLAKSAQAEMLYLTAAEVQAVAEAINPPYGTLVLFAAYTGLRAGEIGALRMKHLDLLRGRVTVAESVAEVLGHGLIYGPTKTYAVRPVALPNFLRDPLMALTAPYASDPEALVFRAPDGGPLRHGNFYRRQFKPAVRRGLPPHLHGLRFHDLRHTCASLLINPPISANPKAVQTRLGHSSIQITFDRYGHLYPGFDEHLGDGLDALYLSACQSNEVRGLAIPLTAGAL